MKPTTRKAILWTLIFWIAAFLITEAITSCCVCDGSTSPKFKSPKPTTSAPYKVHSRDRR